MSDKEQGGKDKKGFSPENPPKKAGFDPPASPKKQPPKNPPTKK